MLDSEKISLVNKDKTKKLLLVVVLASLCFSSAPAHYHKVKFVYDGDTILLETGEQVRYLGIDAPEVNHEGGKSEFMAHAALEFNRKLLKDAQIRLEFDQEKQDRYGRLLAYVFLKNGKMVNELLVQKGMAHIMFKNEDLKYRDLLLDSQRRAMKHKKGVWSKRLKNKGKLFLGNSNSLRFHLPDCPFGRMIAKKNLVKFKSIRDAFWEGYSPCRQCRP